MSSTLTCEQCNTKFQAPSSPYVNRTYCGRECADESGSRRGGEYRECAWGECDITFYTTPSEDAEYCSKSCANEDSKEYDVCENCGEEFYGHPSNPNRFCSKECKQELRREESAVAVQCDREGCDTDIEEKHGNLEWRRREHDHVYCSDECRRLASRTGKHLTCKACREEFYEPRWKIEEDAYSNDYCSAECRHGKEIQSGSWENSTCKECGEEFEYFTLHRSGKFCSQECYWRSLRPDGVAGKPTKECQRCGESFEVPPSKVDEYKYCSEECRKGVIELFGQPVMKKCSRCGKTKSIDDFPEQYSAKRGKSYRLRTCKKCLNQRKKERYHSDDWGGYTSTCKTCGNEFSHYSPDRHFCSRECSDTRNHPRGGRKWCNGCGRRLSVDQFRDEPEHSDGLSSRCKRCLAIAQHRRENLPGDFDSSDIFRQWHRQNGECFWCGDRCGDTPSDADYHIDHLTPVSRRKVGPTNHPRNLVIACAGCNYAKHKRLPIEFKRYRLEHKGAEKTYARGCPIDLP